MIKHTISHTLSHGAVQQLMNKAMLFYQQQYPQYEPTINWVSSTQAEITVAVKKWNLAAEVVLLERQLQIAVNVPFLLRAFESKAIERINKEVQKWLVQTPETVV